MELRSLWNLNYNTNTDYGIINSKKSMYSTGPTKNIIKKKNHGKFISEDIIREKGRIQKNDRWGWGWSWRKKKNEFQKYLTNDINVKVSVTQQTSSIVNVINLDVRDSIVLHS